MRTTLSALGICTALLAGEVRGDDPQQPPLETPAPAVEAEEPKHVVKIEQPPVSTTPAEGTQKDVTGATATSNDIKPPPPSDLPPPTTDARAAAATVSEERPINEYRAGDLSVAVKLNARVSGQADSAFPVDPRQTAVAPAPVDTRFRIAPEIHFGGFGLAAETDVYSGAYGGLPTDGVGYGATPYADREPAHFRQAYVEYKAPSWVLRLGQQTSSWGLGLVANAGNQDAPAGEFGDARLGDLTYRALIAGRPFFGRGGAWRAIEPALAFDVVNRDDFATFQNGDRALQGVAALRFAIDQNRQLGVYTVYRRQRAVGNDPDLRATDVLVLDVAGRWEWKRGSFYRSIGFETAYFTGTTTQARTDQAPRSSVEQFGAALKTSYGYKNFQTYLDWGYASGDQNPYDDRLQAFRFDPDYNAGFILYDQVLATMTARTSANAADPSVVGVPQDGVELLPTRGAISGSTYVFPRLRYGIAPWLDVYGGPLLAWTTAKWVDPFAARINGGESLNSLGGAPGNFLGGEVDLGVQARWRPMKDMTLSATAEAGTFFPGDAFTTANGDVMGPVAAGRLRLALNL